MNKELELRIKDWMYKAECLFADVSLADLEGFAINECLDHVSRADVIFRDILSASTIEAITEQNFQAAQSVLGEGDL